MMTTTLQAKALYANNADTEEELSFSAGDVLVVHERDVAGLVGWWLCSHAGRIGIAPSNRLRLLAPTNVANVNNGDHQASNSGKQNSSSAMKPRPATAPQRGHTAHDNALVVPHKSGNVYIYDDIVHQSVDYDVPTTPHAAQRTSNASVIATVESLTSQDYDVPTTVCSTSYRYNDDDPEFGVGDYDLLTPPQRPASDVDCNLSSNRSSTTSVMSGGSLSSGCASVRSAQSPYTCIAPSTITAGARMNGCGPHLSDQSAPRRSSDNSADSGIALQAALYSPVNNGTSTLSSIFCGRNDTSNDVDCLDYDVPMASVTVAEKQRLDVFDERRIATQRQCPPSIKHVSPVINDESRLRNDSRCTDDARIRRIEQLRDCVLRNVQRFLSWSGRASGDACTDVAATRQCYGQAKLAGLAVRTSLKEFIAIVDGNPPELLYHHIEPLKKSLFEINCRLDRLLASNSEGYQHRAAGSTAAGRRAAKESPVCRDRLHAVTEIVADLPLLVQQFAVCLATNPSVAVRLLDDVDVIPSSQSYVSSKIQQPQPPQRKDSHQRDKPPLSPPAVASASSRGRRPPLGKPPPVKPKPPKSVTWKRPPVQTRPVASPGTTTTTTNDNVYRPNSAKHERRVAEMNEKNGLSTDGWNEDDCDYVSIVREVEQEMAVLGKPVTKNSMLRMDQRSSAALSDDDRELLAFYAAQISAHAADVDAATAEFYRCCPSPSTSPSVDSFVRRSRFVVLAAHRLVYVGDVIARHMTDQSIGNRVAAAANELCNKLKAVVIATRDAAVATANNENVVVLAGIRQTMMDSVRRATDDSRRLCDLINAVACQLPVMFG